MLMKINVLGEKHVRLIFFFLPHLLLSREHQLQFLGYPSPLLPGRAIKMYPCWIDNVILGYKAWKLLSINSKFL